MKISKQKPFIISLFVLIIIVSLHYLGALKPFQRFFLYATKPIANSFYNMSAKTNKTFNESQDENPHLTINRLQEELASLTIEKSEYQEVMDENKRLKELLGFVAENDFQLVLASVVAKENFEQNSLDLIIDKGSLDGLSSGLAVVNEQGVLIGKIVETKDSISKICLSINPGCEFSASIQNSGRTQGLVSGNLGLTAKMGYIPQLEKLKLNDLVITSGLGGKIPRGLVIGKITEIRSEKNEVWQEAIIEAPLDFDNLTIVSVVIP